jgi:hypothetical protein
VTAGILRQEERLLNVGPEDEIDARLIGTCSAGGLLCGLDRHEALKAILGNVSYIIESH